MPVGDDRLVVATRNLPPPWRGSYFEAIESTQDEARQAARAGAPNRSAFVADFQRAGRGRRGRAWAAPPGTALLVSLLFRDATGREPAPFHWTSLAALSLVE